MVDMELCRLSVEMIVYQIINMVQIYSLNDAGLYDQLDVVKNNGSIRSSIFSGFTVAVEELF